MIQFQNNFTTPEQSKRLLELGVPADSADCIISTEISVIVIPNGVTYSEYSFSTDTPCWSVGRLIEILSHCYNWTDSCEDNFTGGALCIPRYTHQTNYKGGAIGYIINQMEAQLKTKVKLLDFSKLEE